MERAVKWMPMPELDTPCADISFKWESKKGAVLVVVMHYSRVRHGLGKDLEITFRDALAVRWEEESWGLIDSPQDLPTCSRENFAEWTHPMLIIKDSSWVELYANRRYSEGAPDAANITHYFLVSMNDLLHVLGNPNPEVRWVESID